MTVLDPLPTPSPIRSLYANDPDYGELLDLFLAELPERSNQMERLFSDGDLDELRVCAHQLKGAGGGYGFPKLTEFARELELACKAHSPEVDARLRETLDYLQRMLPLV